MRRTATAPIKATTAMKTMVSFEVMKTCANRPATFRRVLLIG